MLDALACSRPSLTFNPIDDFDRELVHIARRTDAGRRIDYEHA